VRSDITDAGNFLTSGSCKLPFFADLDRAAADSAGKIVKKAGWSKISASETGGADGLPVMTWHPPI